MAPETSEKNATASKKRKSGIILAFSALAAVHFFVFAAAFPFGNNMDEPGHFDLVVKYSHGHLPRGLESMCEESSRYLLVYGSPEFRFTAASMTNGVYPVPFWLHRTGMPSEKIQRAEALNNASRSWFGLKDLPVWQNYESSEQPLYYMIAGIWWNIGKAIGLDGLRLLYWLRFLNFFFVCGTVLLAYFIAKSVFPQNHFIQFGAPAMVALFPQMSFYSIENDVLSPLSFGLVFIALVKFWREKIPSAGIAVFLGLAMAAAFLVKLSNVPMLLVAGSIVVLKLFFIQRNGSQKSTLPVFIIWFCCGAIPVGVWLAWTKYAFGDFTGTAAKIHFITWTPKPFSQWWHHPIFSLNGLWTFISELIIIFWQGDLHWDGLSFDLPVVDAVYVLLSLSFVLLAILKRHIATSAQRQILLWIIALLLANVIFFIYLSIRYDFGMCPYPSKEHPFFVAGRLILGALIPFILSFLFGMHCLFCEVKYWIQFAALGILLLFMLISEIITDWPVFQSQYNWYHI